MSLQSDITINYEKLKPAAVTEKTNALNAHIRTMMEKMPRWWEVGAAEYRRMRWAGETPLPGPVVLDSGEDILIASRQKGHMIPCRVFRPASAKPKSVYYHIHGGGWVLGSERSQDPMLKRLADECHLTVLSVGYRLAPEHPYPKPNEDCYDVADWLVDHAVHELGAPLGFIGGESAGAHLGVVTLYHLLESKPAFALRGLVLYFGAYNLVDFPPSAYQIENPLVLDTTIMSQYVARFLLSSNLWH